jgi:hypothetical protein
MDINDIRKEWFFMQDIKKTKLVKKTWIPIYASKYIYKNGHYGENGYIEDFFGVNSVLIDCEQKKNVNKKIINQIIQYGSCTPGVDENTYIKAGTFFSDDNTITGDYLVLKQNHPTDTEQSIFHINQDLILAFDLIQHEDSFIRPIEDNIEVVRFRKNSSGRIDLVEIKKELLLDYLSARSSCLIIDRFHQRIINSKNKFFKQNEEIHTEETKDSQWEAQQFEIYKGGHKKDSSAIIITVKKTDVDYKEDVPKYNFNESYESTSREVQFSGNILISVISEYRRYEILDNNGISQRIRNDVVESTIPFIIDNDGKTELPNQFHDKICWLWFKPDIVLEIMKRENAILGWYTEYTGSLGPNSRYCVHFGVNKLCYINVFAKDIAALPEIYKKLWAAYSTIPDGNVSKELLMAQMECNPAPTHSPEKCFRIGIAEFERAFKEKYNRNIFCQHQDEKELLRSIHRFQAINKEGLFRLAKIMTKYLIERMDQDFLKKITCRMPKKTGTIKRLENILNSFGVDGRGLTSPFIGIYELRHSDSHLGSSELAQSFKLLKITFEDNKENYISEAHQIINFISYRLHEIGEIFKNAV